MFLLFAGALPLVLQAGARHPRSGRNEYEALAIDLRHGWPRWRGARERSTLGPNLSLGQTCMPHSQTRYNIKSRSR
jgi:hypothetical protein